jgi:A-kinase anchor protein 1, mitochondrial
MISKRPVYYTILPSLIIIGYIWYRRKKNLDNESIKKASKVDDKQDNLYSSPSSSAVATLKNNSQPSESLPIETPHNNNQNFCSSKTLEEEEEVYNNNKENQSPGSSSSGSSASSLLKSAPIDIAPNPRSPPKRVTEQEIDSEILKLKPGDSDIKNLLFVEEPELDSDIDDSPTPADSPLYRSRHFGSSQVNKPVSEPVVIKGTMEAKISPENSFRERKYTHTESDECSANRHETIDSDKVMENDDVEIADVTEKSNNNVAMHQKRSSNSSQQQQIASPSLSMCSVHSGMIVNFNLFFRFLKFFDFF